MVGIDRVDACRSWRRSLEPVLAQHCGRIYGCQKADFSVASGDATVLQVHVLRERLCELVIATPFAAAPDPDMNDEPLFHDHAEEPDTEPRCRAICRARARAGQIARRGLIAVIAAGCADALYRPLRGVGWIVVSVPEIRETLVEFRPADCDPSQTIAARNRMSIIRSQAVGGKASQMCRRGFDQARVRCGDSSRRRLTLVSILTRACRTQSGARSRCLPSTNSQS